MKSHPKASVRILMLDNPRSCSQVFRRLFQNHPQLGHMIHIYTNPSIYGPERIQLKLRHCPTAEETQKKWAVNFPDRRDATFESTTEDFLQEVTKIEQQAQGESDTERLGPTGVQSRIPFIKEHLVNVLKQDIILSALRGGHPDVISTNPTYIPDDFLRTVSPIMLIRNPVQVVPSLYRVMKDLGGLQVDDEDFAMLTSMRWSRMMWAYFSKNPAAREPILVDAEDVLHNPEVIISIVCNMLGIDPNGVEYEWDAVPEEHMPQDPLGIVQGFVRKMLKSKGLVRQGAQSTPDINDEYAKWEHEFGQETAKGLKARVDAEMADYKYLRQFKLSA